MKKRRVRLSCVPILLLICLSCQEKDPHVTIQEISVEPSALTLKEGETHLLKVQWSPSEVKASPTFTSEDEAIATVTDTGEVRACAAGETKIQVSLGGKSAYCQLRVVKRETTSPVTEVIIDPQEISMDVGEKQKISVRWLPADAEATAVFASSDTQVAIVDEQGVVEALSPGEAKVKVMVQEASAVCSITVSLSQMPLLAFGKDQETQRRIEAYEHNRGRELCDGVVIQGDFKANAFVSKSLDLFPVVSYGKEDNNDNPIIVVLGKEEIGSCTRTLELLRKSGFSNVKVQTNDYGKMMLRASHDGNDNLVLLGQAQQIAESSVQPATQMILMIINKDGYPLPHKLHDCILDAKDFPSWQEFMSGKTEDVKAFEETLGFRYFNEAKSSATNLLFTTKSNQTSHSNIDWVYYVRDPESWTPFIDCQINCIDRAEEIDTEAVRTWLANNGFNRNFKRAFSKEDWYYVWNSDRTVGLQLYIDRKRGICAMQIFPGDVLSSFE